MRFVTVRDLRARWAEISGSLSDDDVVVTSNGRPLAVLVPVDEGGLESTVEGIRRWRAQEALSELRRVGARTGLAGISPDEIDAEVAASRRARRR